MDNFIKIILKKVIALTLVASFSVAADTKTIDEAVKRYYAGFPDEAISMMKPLALSGDENAQYLLGNILYGLSKTKNFSDIDSPIKWYRMAAEQDSAAANYALGVIFHNKWRESRDKKEASTAIIFILDNLKTMLLILLLLPMLRHVLKLRIGCKLRR